MKNLKKLSRNALKEVMGGKLPQVWIATTKCGFTATTTQDWTPQQANAWMDEIEKNYCKTPTYSGNDAIHLAIN